ncbi:MAG: YciI family protein [Rhodospirillales bacterium]|nr:YciI family protein [Rhodospirillales bacterium]
MLFMITCWDKPGREALRLETRSKHLEYLGRFKDRVFAVGPLQSDDGTAMIGSLLLMEFADRQAAEAFTADDPYARAGLFESVIVRRWKKIMPAD